MTIEHEENNIISGWELPINTWKPQTTKPLNDVCSGFFTALHMRSSNISCCYHFPGDPACGYNIWASLVVGIDKFSSCMLYVGLLCVQCCRVYWVPIRRNTFVPAALWFTMILHDQGLWAIEYVVGACQFTSYGVRRKKARFPRFFHPLIHLPGPSWIASTQTSRKHFTRRKTQHFGLPQTSTMVNHKFL